MGQLHAEELCGPYISSLTDIESIPADRLPNDLDPFTGSSSMQGRSYMAPVEGPRSSFQCSFMTRCHDFQDLRCRCRQIIGVIVKAPVAYSKSIYIINKIAEPIFLTSES